MPNKIEWTNKNVIFRDIRLIDNFYYITLLNESNSETLYDSSQLITVKFNSTVLNNVLSSYYLVKKDFFARDEILTLKWNLVLTKGFYYKNINDSYVEMKKEPDQWYISYININSPSTYEVFS